MMNVVIRYLNKTQAITDWQIGKQIVVICRQVMVQMQFIVKIVVRQILQITSVTIIVTLRKN